MDSSGSAAGVTEEEDLRAEVTFECSLWAWLPLLDFYTDETVTLNIDMMVTPT